LSDEYDKPILDNIDNAEIAEAVSSITGIYTLIA
jgi:hypothetical protein